ncbi:MAG: ABC transporter permease [Planctomycetota bacterium]|nr:ABC transporter permease [Planctomycetota bacterium]
MNIVTMALKDLKLLWRDKLGLFWSLVFPLIMALFFGSILGGNGGNQKGLKIIALDLDQSKGSKALLDHLESSDSVSLTMAKADQELGALRGAVLKGRYVAYVMIPKGYGGGNMFFQSDSDANLKVGIDPARRAEAGYLKGILAEGSMKRLTTQFQDPKDLRAQIKKQEQDIDSAEDLKDADKKELKSFMGSFDRLLDKVDFNSGSSTSTGMANPINFQIDSLTAPRTKPASAFEVSFPSAILWAILGTVASFTISLVKERKSGTLFRLYVAPQSIFHIVAGKALACLLACLFVSVVLTLIGTLAFGVRLQNLPGYVLALSSTSFCFVGMMMCLSVLGKTEESVAGSSWGIMLVMAMLGGGMVPLLAMPSWMLTLSHISPVKWGILALEGAIWRGFEMGDFLLPCAILISVGVVALMAGSFIFRKVAYS